MSNPYKQVEEFHQAFEHDVAEKPTPISPEVAINRASWSGEELVEFLYATANNDLDLYHSLFLDFIGNLIKTSNKIIDKGEKIEDVLVAQADALTDANYFNYGSFVIMGVDPAPLFDIVQNANMGKLWEDGKPRFREEDGKIIKPPHWEEMYAPEPKLKAEIERQKNQ